MRQWFYQVLGDILGPIDEDELRDKILSGQLPPNTLVASEKGGPWEEARLLFGLANADGAPSGEEALGETEGVASDSISPEAIPTTGMGIAVSPRRETAGRSPLALRPCSDCGWMVSREASSCPRCGRIFHETSSLLTYHGEHPLSVLIFFSLLALLFLVGSPVLVYLVAATVVEALQPGETLGFMIPRLVTASYIISMVICALLGGAVGKPRMAYLTGLFLGLFFGPLGVFVAYGIDKRPQCPHCTTRLNGLARQCPMCHARLLWRVAPTWV